MDIELEEYTDCALKQGTEDLMVDDRFISTDFRMTEFEIMEENGILKGLERLPKYHDQVEHLKANKKDTEL